LLLFFELVIDVIFENRLLRKTAVFPLQMPLPDIIELSDRWQVGLFYILFDPVKNMFHNNKCSS